MLPSLLLAGSKRLNRLNTLLNRPQKQNSDAEAKPKVSPFLSQGRQYRFYPPDPHQKKRRSNQPFDISFQSHNDLPDDYTPITTHPGFTEITPSHQIPVARLANELRHVLSEPGIHFVKDPVSLQYFFSPYWEKIVHPVHICFDAIPPFITTSKDQLLHKLAIENNCPIKSSTSSTTGILSQLYFALSNFRPVNTTGLSGAFSDQITSFTTSTVKPVSIFLRNHTDAWAVDSDSGFNPPGNQILLDLGKSIERMLTMEEKQFQSSLLKAFNPELNPDPEAYHYLQVGNMLIRSQLDCWDPSIPRARKTFDVKTRAVMPIRYDVENYLRYTDYNIDRLKGSDHSFEREFYDMIRSAFIKYCFQVRIGRMDGAFVAYHNTRQVFGYEYVQLSEMDRCVFGSPEFAEIAFSTTTQLMESVLDTIRQLPKNRDRPSVRVLLYADPSANHRMLVMSCANNEDSGWNESAKPGVYDNKTIEKIPFKTYFDSLNVKPEDLDLFYLNLHVELNGEKSTGPLLYQPGDHLAVGYKLEKQNLSNLKIVDLYSQILQASLDSHGDKPFRKGKRFQY